MLERRDAVRLYFPLVGGEADIASQWCFLYWRGGRGLLQWSYGTVNSYCFTEERRTSSMGNDVFPLP